MATVTVQTSIQFSEDELSRLRFIIETLAELRPELLIGDSDLRETISQAYFQTPSGQATIALLDEALEGIEIIMGRDLDTDV